jgi:hypothetical protein
MFVKMTVKYEVNDNTKKIYKHTTYKIITVQNISRMLDTVLCIVFTHDKLIYR